MDWDAAIAQKYAILQQQANSAQYQAQTGRITGQAEADLANTRNQLLPGESAATIGEAQARTGLLGQQARYWGTDVLSNAGLRAAEGANQYAEARSNNIAGSVNYASNLEAPAAGSNTWWGLPAHGGGMPASGPPPMTRFDSNYQPVAVPGIYSGGVGTRQPAIGLGMKTITPMATPMFGSPGAKPPALPSGDALGGGGIGLGGGIRRLPTALGM